MKRLSVHTSIYLTVDIVLLILCILHIPSLVERAQAPFRVEDKDHQVGITKFLDSLACPKLRRGDELLSWEDRQVSSAALIEFLANQSSIDEQITVSYRRSDVISTTSIKLIRAFGPTYIIIVCLVGVVTWCLAVFVLLARPRDLTASILHWSLISMAVVVVIAFDGITPNSILQYLSCILFFVSYMGAATTFFLFTAMFPRHKPGSLALKFLLVYTPAVGLTVAMMHYHWRATFIMGAEDIRIYSIWYNNIYISVLVFVGGGILNFIHSYITAASGEERKKLKWVLWGLCLGPTPFLTLVILPSLIWGTALVPEEYTLIFLIIIPVAFAISFVKHHLLDIEVVINRTTVYAIVLGALIATYVLLVALATNYVREYIKESYAVAAVLIGLLFEPARRSVQRFVDRRFFRVRWNFREAERSFVEGIKKANDVQQIAEVIVSQTDELIPVERIGFFVLKEPGNRLNSLAHKNFDLFDKYSVRFEAEKLKTRLQLPLALDNKVEPGITYESADEKVFRRWGMALVFPMIAENSESLGFLVLGEKKAGTRFTTEEVDLLNNISTQAGLEIERLTLQVKLILEQAEKQRLEELNQLKSLLVSYVSHELLNPLSSIKVFSQLLNTRPRKLDRKSQDFVQTIEGETDRLARMVTNILDSAKIENREKVYFPKSVDLREITQDVLKSMTYQLKKAKFTVNLKGRRAIPIFADPDAVKQTIINLVSNSIKYAGEKRYIQITLSRDARWALCSIEDRGLGIAKESQSHLFERYYRDPSASLHIQGVGLGLPLVKHIMDEHGGKIELVRSEVGKGSIFRLSFPLNRKHNEPKEKNPRR
ncbi:MAG: ATP-binding protein [Ignavibacteria bacterium]|nr:ATP-binding protein [Ignavibacteria bacterium]